MVNSHEDKSNDLYINLISRITNGSSLKEIAENVEFFLQFIEENKSQRVYFCRTLVCTIFEYTQKHHLDHMMRFESKNVIVLSHEESPLYLLRSYIGGQKQVGKIISRLNEFLKHCQDYIEPTGIDITIWQIELVVDIAQRRFGLIDIVAPVNPLVILRLNNTNKRCNSMCGVIGEGSNTRAILMIFNPRAGDGNDPVYIFSHELGHAFHLALTHEAQIMPAKFDEMNGLLGVEKNIPLSDKIELFADVFAMALLNCPELKEHDPFAEFGNLTPYFDKYIGALASGQI